MMTWIDRRGGGTRMSTKPAKPKTVRPKKEKPAKVDGLGPKMTPTLADSYNLAPIRLNIEEVKRHLEEAHGPWTTRQQSD